VNGTRAVYLPILKQGGSANTIAVVDSVRRTLGNLVDVPAALRVPGGGRVAFDAQLS